MTCEGSDQDRRDAGHDGRATLPGARSTAAPPLRPASAELIRNWREAASLLDAACMAVAVLETPETVAIQDAANARATAAFGALAAVVALDPIVLRAHADALEWLIAEFGALGDGQHDAVLGQSIAAELRALADEREQPARTDGQAG